VVLQVAAAAAVERARDERNRTFLLMTLDVNSRGAFSNHINEAMQACNPRSAVQAR
jgi:hypothetical protein